MIVLLAGQFAELADRYSKGVLAFALGSGAFIGFGVGLLPHQLSDTQSAFTVFLAGSLMLGKFSSIFVAVFLLLRLAFIGQMELVSGLGKIQTLSSSNALGNFGDRVSQAVGDFGQPAAHVFACVWTVFIAWCLYLFACLSAYRIGLELMTPLSSESLFNDLLAGMSIFDLWRSLLRTLVVAYALGWLAYAQSFIGGHITDASSHTSTIRYMLLGGVVILVLELMDTFLFFKAPL